MDKLSVDEILEIREAFQETANKWKKAFTVHWNDGKGIVQEVFFPKEENSGQLIFEEMELPKL